MEEASAWGESDPQSMAREIPNPGWTAEGWAQYLCYKADRCQETAPELAAEYRERAKNIETATSGNGENTGEGPLPHGRGSERSRL